MSQREQAFVFESTVNSLLEANTGLRRDRAFLFVLLGGLGISNVIGLLGAFNII